MLQARQMKKRQTKNEEEENAHITRKLFNESLSRANTQTNESGSSLFVFFFLLLCF